MSVHVCVCVYVCAHMQAVSLLLIQSFRHVNYLSSFSHFSNEKSLLNANDPDHRELKD